MDLIIITKIISALIYPMGLILLFACCYAAFKLLKKPFLAWVCGASSIIVFFLGSNSFVAHYLVYTLERQYPQLSIEQFEQHDAIIVLGGALRIPTEPARYAQLAQASDRYWYAAQLYKQNKAPLIILSGGNLYPQPNLQAEAHYAREILYKWGIPQTAIVIETQSRTTNENRRGLQSILIDHEVKSSLLVTSATHMPRAMRVFANLNVTPASADVVARQSNGNSIVAWLPSAAAMQLTTQAMHEYYGMWFDELNAFIDRG